MEKILVIAEKPSLGQAIADALPGEAVKKGGTIQKGNYTIVWAVGHLLTLKNPEDYDAKYKEWTLSHLPIYFSDWQMKVKKGSEERVAQIGGLLKTADVVIHAGDTDEEGQLLIDELLRWFRYGGKVVRLDTANTSVEGMKKALSRLKDNVPEEKAGLSAYGREVGDIIFGYNLTRYYTVLNHSRTPLSVGRVQTPTLGMVVRRDEMIEQHKKQLYYELFSSININGKQLLAKFYPPKDAVYLTEGRVLERHILEDIAGNAVKAGNVSVQIKKEAVSEAPPLPFNLMKLNAYCAKKWGMNPDEVMKVTQSLRDKYNAITYNRSDCQYLSDEHFREAPDVIAACAKVLGIAAEAFDSQRKSRCFNDANITAHFAIIPTTTVFDYGCLCEKEQKVYTAICRYYLAQFLPAAKKEKTVLEARIPGMGIFRAGSVKVIDSGYLSFLSDSCGNGKDEAMEETVLSAVSEGTYTGKVEKPTVKEKETVPPKRYTQESLFADMGAIAKYVKDARVREILLEKDKEKKGENGSIGTVATRAIIIKRLLDAGYLEERTDKKHPYLVSTPKGRAFYEMLPESIKGADITARWWLIQEDIKKGKATPEMLAKSVFQEVEKVILSGEGKLSEKFLDGAEKICKCPKCREGNIVEGKFGAYCGAKCGFSIGSVFGKKPTKEQISALCGGKKALIRGIRKKNGTGTFSAYAVPEGIEAYPYEKDGEERSGYRLKLSLELKK